MDAHDRNAAAASRPRDRTVRTALAIFAVAFLLRGTFVAIHPAPPVRGDMITYEGIAKNIAAGKWHFGWGEEPSAHREPVYPLFVAAVYAVAGPSREAVHWTQAILGATSCALTFLLASILLRGRSAPAAAGLLAAAYPPFLVQTQKLLTEPLATFLLLLATYLTVAGWRERNRRRLLFGAFFLGLATLTRAGNLMYAPLLVVAALLLPAARRTTGKAAPVLFALVFFATLSPWTARNYFVFGKFIPVAVNAGGSFFRGNYDEGTLGCMGSNYDPRMPEEITSKYEGLDEVEIDRLLLREGMRYVRDHPGTFVKLCALKLARFWLNLGFADPPSRSSIAFAFGNGVLLALALLGILAGGAVDHRAAAPVYLLVGYYTALHALLFATARYSMPVMPYVLLFSACGLLTLAERLRSARLGRRP